MTSMEDAKQKVERDTAERKARVHQILESGEDFLDEDGYPTEIALEAIEKWHWDDARGWFEFIKPIWYFGGGWGWREEDVPHEWNKLKGYKDKIVHRYHISTAGWSGNESIIRAMQNNDWMWHLNWVQSRRGGHYIFELKEFNNDE